MSLTGLFGRVVAVEIGIAGAAGVRHSGLRVNFKVEHKASKTSSTATIKIYNPAATTIAQMRIPGASIRLFVGYEPTSRLIFWGDPVKGGIDLKVEGPDRILVVDAADGGQAYTSTFLQVGFTTPTTFGQVLAAVLAQTQWARGYIEPSIEAIQLPHGIALVGRPAEVLDRLAAAVPVPGADWFVRDGSLYVVSRIGSTPEVAPLISSRQGNLIGSPVATKKGVKLRALIDATMRPGRQFLVESAGISGLHTCKDATFTGDSGYSNEFYMDLTANAAGIP